MNQERQLTAMLIQFYLGETTDREGRKIQEMWTWDFEQLECAHDYNSVAHLSNSDVNFDRPLQKNLKTPFGIF